jgi:hypothetical protein
MRGSYQNNVNPPITENDYQQHRALLRAENPQKGAKPKTKPKAKPVKKPAKPKY